MIYVSKQQQQQVKGIATVNRIESCIVAAYPHHLLQLTVDKSGGHFATGLRIELEKETAHGMTRQSERRHNDTPAMAAG